MTFTLSELADRAEIEDALHAYAQAQDQDKWQLFDRVFSGDSVIELKGLPVPPLNAEAMRGFLQDFNRTRVTGQHLITNTLIELNGDEARSVSEVFHLTLQTTEQEGVLKRSRGGSLYADAWSRTEDGWRITHRVVTQKHLDESEVEYSPELLQTISAGAGIDWFTVDLKNGGLA
ncbi:nuclear transport factor 2 family protein [Leucobacter denitrificans]|uniref:Nuclear transport factor 2 family protein n=1 Tax=Leucobacter denitrificans TaxID=683042 RepID=A0A7G9S497_9MICO|nr:nuclear transport factor 2 family protein [Leucobacter denitrificans]QNN62672.1 nuclear transport factor 2 family protein [Leucobacter denitrificans]